MHTPGRQTFVVVDSETYTVSDKIFKLSKFPSKMFQTCKDPDISYLTWSRGLCVKPKNVDISFVTTDPAVYTSMLPLTKSAEFVPINASRKPSMVEMPGVNIGPGIPAQSHPLFQKKIPSHVDWGYGRLVHDSDAYPIPSSSDCPYINENYQYDRVAVTEDPLFIGDDIFVEVYAENGDLDTEPTAGVVLFVGPPCIGDSDGFEYALIFRGNAELVLMCKISDTWRMVGSTRAVEEKVNHWYLWIQKSALGNEEGSGMGGYISIRNLVISSSQSLTGGSPRFPDESMPTYPESPNYATLGDELLYKVPCNIVRTDPLRELTGRVRLSMRRDLKGGFNIYKSTYPTNILELNDDDFVIESTFRDSAGANDYKLTYWCRKPSGCTMDLKLISNDTNTEAELLSTRNALVNADFYVVEKVYKNVPEKQKYHVRLNMQAVYGETPKLYYYAVEKNGIVNIYGQPEKVLNSGSYKYCYPTRIGITGQTRALDYNKATIEIADLGDAADFLHTRSSMPIRIETTYDPNDQSKRCVLFRGFVQKAVRSIRPMATRNGKESFSTYTVMANGVWQLLKENFHENQAEVMFVDSIDANGKADKVQTGSKVTDLISTYLSRVGFPKSDDFPDPGYAMQDIADDPTKVFAFGNDQTLVVNPLDDYQKVIESLLTDYMEGFLIWDDNLGYYGKWVYKKPPKHRGPKADAPVAVFYTNPPAHVADKKFDYLPSYANSPVTDINGTTHYVQGAWIVKDTWESWVKPPEANDVIVTGVGAITEKGGTKLTTARLFNAASFNVDPTRPTADPNSPDFLGRRVPLWVLDPGIAVGDDQDTQELKVRLVCRRIYDMVAHGIKKATFRAPLVIIRHPDDPTRVRPLRFYDLVYIDNSPWLIRAVNPQYTKDGYQYAMYEVEAPRI